jgi:hypothetical protein
MPNAEDPASSALIPAKRNWGGSRRGSGRKKKVVQFGASNDDDDCTNQTPQPIPNAHPQPSHLASTLPVANRFFARRGVSERSESRLGLASNNSSSGPDPDSQLGSGGTARALVGASGISLSGIFRLNRYLTSINHPVTGQSLLIQIHARLTLLISRRHNIPSSSKSSHSSRHTTSMLI